MLPEGNHVGFFFLSFIDSSNDCCPSWHLFSVVSVLGKSSVFRTQEVFLLHKGGNKFFKFKDVYLHLFFTVRVNMSCFKLYLLYLLFSLSFSFMQHLLRSLLKC